MQIKTGGYFVHTFTAVVTDSCRKLPAVKQFYSTRFFCPIHWVSSWLFLVISCSHRKYSYIQLCFGYVFQLRALPEFKETEFVLFMMLGYLPWFALAESLGKSTSLLIDKAGLITKVKFPGTNLTRCVCLSF